MNKPWRILASHWSRGLRPFPLSKKLIGMRWMWKILQTFSLANAVKVWKISWLSLEVFSFSRNYQREILKLYFKNIFLRRAGVMHYVEWKYSYLPNHIHNSIPPKNVTWALLEPCSRNNLVKILFHLKYFSFVYSINYRPEVIKMIQCL